MKRIPHRKSTVFGEKPFKISAKKGKNIEELKQIIYDIVIDRDIISNNVIITSVRHAECLKHAFNSILNALNGILDVSLDLTAIDLNDAFMALGEITGTTSNEVVLDSIFSKFCLGK